MNHNYIFDKRLIKKLFIKYGLIFLGLLPILILINFLLGSVGQGTLVFVDVAVGLIFILVVEIIISKIARNREEKAEIMAKKKNKEKQLDNTEVIEITEVEVRNEKNKTKDKEDSK